MSKVTAYYHIVFCTKLRENTIPMALRDDVYRFIWNEIKMLNCELIRIGGVQNHIHILLNLHPAANLSTLMQNIKGRASVWMKSDGRFPNFKGWARDYYACTISPEQKYKVIEYIRSQEIHHLGCKFDDEVGELYGYAGLKYDIRDLL